MRITHHIPLLLAPLFSAALLGQAHLQVAKTTLDLGQIDAAGAPIPFSFELKNTGDEELRLQWLDIGHSAILADIDKGLLQPGESTKVRGSLDPRHLVGAFTAKIDLHAEDIQSPITQLDLKAQITPDIIPVGACEATVSNLALKQIRTLPEFIFKARSGDAIDPNGTKVLTSANSALACKVSFSFDKNALSIVPTLQESKLPSTPQGTEQITVQIDTIEYPIIIHWIRETPLLLSPRGDGSFFVTAPDNRPFKIQKVVTTPKLQTKVSRDGNGFVITTISSKRKPVSATGITVTTNHPFKKSISWSATK